MASLRLVIGSAAMRLRKPSVIHNSRCVGQLTHLDGESLWKSVRADVKKVGGRGKRTKKRKTIDLGKDKKLGEGKLGYIWPALNTKPGDKISQRTAEEQASYLQRMREEKEQVVSKAGKVPPNMRGWTGGLWGGQEVLAMDEAAETFKSYIFEASRVSHMADSVGRVYSMRVIVGIGDGSGTYGVGMDTADDVYTASRKARMKALKRLRFAERFEDRTIYEDMYVNHHRTFMHLRQQPEGYGLRCHRALITLCKIIGIKDLYVKTYGATTMRSLLKCFMKALQAQETYQQQADRLGYHIVQCDPLRDNYPVVLASPSGGSVKKEPYDEYYAYLNKPLVRKYVRQQEGWHNDPFKKILYPDSQGPPIPDASDFPHIMAKIKDEMI